MKVTNLEITISIDQFNRSVKIDDLNNTRMWVNDTQVVEVDGEIAIPCVTEGDFIELQTRSSTWWGEVVCIEEGVVTLLVDALGVHQSVVEGLSGLLTWRVSCTDYAVIETSIWDTPVPWDTYLNAKRIATKLAALAANYDIEARNTLWREILAIYMTE